MRLKAASIVNNIALLKERLGEAGFARLREGLPAHTRALVDRRILAVEWIEGRDWLPVQEAVLAARGEDGLKAIMHEVCERDLNSVYRFFMRHLVSPAFVIARATKVLEMYAEGCTLTLTREADHVEVRMHTDEVQPVWPVLVHAFIEKLLLLSGAQDVQVERATTVSAQAMDSRFTVRFK